MLYPVEQTDRSESLADRTTFLSHSYRGLMDRLLDQSDGLRGSSRMLSVLHEGVEGMHAFLDLLSRAARDEEALQVLRAVRCQINDFLDNSNDSHS